MEAEHSGDTAVKAPEEEGTEQVPDTAGAAEEVKEASPTGEDKVESPEQEKEAEKEKEGDTAETAEETSAGAAAAEEWKEEAQTASPGEGDEAWWNERKKKEGDAKAEADTWSGWQDKEKESPEGEASPKKEAEEENAGHEEAAGHGQEEVPQEPPAPPREITEVEEVTIPRDKVAKFYEVGTIGTKPFMPPRKRVSLVSSATITAPEGAEEGKEDVTYTVSSESPLITRRALKYIKLLLHNSDWVPEGEAEDDGDLTMLEVPESVYNFVIGKQGAFLHTICEEANALAFFLKKPLEPNPVATGPPKPVAPWLDVGKHIEVRVSPDHRQPHEKGVILEVLKGNALKIKLASDKVIELSAGVVRPHFQAEDSVLVMDKRLGERPVDGTVVSTEKDTVTVKVEGKEDDDELKEITVEHSAVRFRRQLPKAEEEGDEEKEKEKESVPEHRIAIFGDVKARVFVQAKLMASVEKKLPGFYQNKDIVWGSAEEPWGVNRIELSEDFLPQCIGAGGSMKRKLAAASGAVIEYFEDAPIYALVIGPENSRILATGLIEALRTAERGTIKGVPDELLPFTTVVEVPEDCTAWVTGKGRGFQNGVEEKENVLTFWDKPPWEADDSKNDSKNEWKNEWKSDWKKDTSAAAPASSSGAAAAADTNASSFSYEKYKKDQDAGEEEEADDQAKPTAEESGAAPEKAQDNPQEEGETEEPQEDTKEEKESAAQGAPEETEGDATETKTEKEEEKETKDEKTDEKDETKVEKEEGEKEETKVEKEEGEKDETKTEKDEAKEQKDSEEEEPKEADKEAEEGAETKEEEQWEEETRMVKLIIVGLTERSRQMAALRVQASVEQKNPGFFYNGDDVQHEEEGLATDVLTIDKDMLRWVTGKAGSNRKKIQAASGCGLEFTDSRAIMVGTLAERQRCHEYLEWMIAQLGSKNRVVSLPKSAESRDDVLVMMLTPKEQSCLDNNALSTIETETDCFIVYREILDDEFYSPGSVITMTLGSLTKYAEVQSISSEDGVQGLRFKEVSWTEALDKTVPLMIFGHEEGRNGYTGRRLAEFQVQKWLRAAQGGAHAADQDWQEGASKGDSWGQKKDQGSGSGGNMSWDNWQKGAATKEVTKSNWDTEKNESGGGSKWGGGQGESSWGGGGGSGKRGGGGDWGAESGAGRGARGGDSSWEQSGTGGGSKWGGNKDKEDWSTTAGSGQRGSGGWGSQGQSGGGRVRSDPTPWGNDSSTAGGGGRKGDQGSWGRDEASTSTSRRGAGGDQGGWGNADSTANGSGRRGGGEGGWDKGDSAANGTGRRGGDQWAKEEGATAKQTRGGDWGAAETSTGGRRGGDQGKWGGGAADMSATLATPRRGGDQSWAQPSTGRSSGGGGGASWGEGASAPAAGRRGGESSSWESPAAAAQWPQGAAAAAATTTAASWDAGRNRSTQAAPSTEQLWASYKPGTAAASKADAQGSWEQDKQSARGAGAGGWAGGNASKGAPQTGSANPGGWSAW